MKRGRPRKFQTPEEFEEKAVQYVEFCSQNGRFPNIAGFCVFADITEETFSNQKDYGEDFLESYKKVQNLFADAALNSRAASDTVRIFYMKNKCGYYDRVQADVNVAGTIEALFEKKSLKF